MRITIICAALTALVLGSPACSNKAAADETPAAAPAATATPPPAGADSGDGTPPAASKLPAATPEQLAGVAAEFEAIAGKLCDCKDTACMKVVQGSVLAVMKKTMALGRPDPNAPTTQKFMRRMKDAGTKMRDCAKALAETPSTD